MSHGHHSRRPPRAPGSHGRVTVPERAPLLQVALDLTDRPDVRLARVLRGVPARLPLPQQVPALVEVLLELPQPGPPVVVDVALPELVLLVDESGDLGAQVAVVGGRSGVAGAHGASVTS